MLTLGLALQCKEAVPRFGACGDQQTHISMVIMRTKGGEPWKKSSFLAGVEERCNWEGGERGSALFAEIRAVPRCRVSAGYIRTRHRRATG